MRLAPSHGRRRAVAPARAALVRPRWALGAFAYLASIGLVATMLVEPPDLSAASPLASEDEAVVLAEVVGQSVPVTGEVAVESRDGFDVVKPRPVAPAVGTPDPGTAQAIAYEMLSEHGWDQSEYECLVALWTRESHWNVYAHNTSSGAYGIPQALPGTKMASAGDDWKTNPTTQITWGLGYIKNRYGTPCGAWGHSELKGWY